MLFRDKMDEFMTQCISFIYLKILCLFQIFKFHDKVPIDFTFQRVQRIKKKGIRFPKVIKLPICHAVILVYDNIRRIKHYPGFTELRGDCVRPKRQRNDKAPQLETVDGRVPKCR